MRDSRIENIDRVKTIGLLLGVILLLIPAARAQTPATAAPRLEIATLEWNFGEKWAGEKAETTIALKNVGDAPLEITKIKSSCGCTVAKMDQKVLQPGESAVATVSYNTGKRGANVIQRIHVHTNDPIRPVATITVKGKVKQLIETADARGLRFDTIGRRDQVTKSVEVTCVYPEPLDLKLKQSKSETFDLKLETIEPGRRYKIIATTKPPMQYGVIRANATLLTGLEAVPEFNLRVWGTVRAPVAVTPKAIYVAERHTDVSTRLLRVISRREQPLGIIQVSANNPAIKFEVTQPDATGDAASKSTQMAVVRVILPPASEIDDAGAMVTIKTNDDEYPELLVPVLKKTPSAKTAKGNKKAKITPKGDPAGTGKESKP